MRKETEQQAVAWQMREDACHNGFEDDDWEECSRDEYEKRLEILAGRASARMAGSFDDGADSIREDEGGWWVQVRALYPGPQSSVAEDSLRALIERWKVAQYYSDVDAEDFAREHAIELEAALAEKPVYQGGNLWCERPDCAQPKGQPCAFSKCLNDEDALAQDRKNWSQP